MRAGKLRSKIDILRYKEVELENGATSNEWVLHLKSVKCDDRVISSRDQARNGTELSEEVHTIELRYRSDITDKDRVRLFDGRTLAINGRPKPNPDQKNKSMIITAVYDGK